MANTLTEVIDKLLAQGLLALREQAVMPLLVNRQYEAMAGTQGSTIDVPIPSAIAAIAVTPAATPPSTAAVAPTSVPIALDQWYEAPFYLTDKEQMEVQAGTIPMQASEAIKALGNNVDAYLLALYSKFYGYVGTAGTTPFTAGTTADATQLRKTLNNQLAPLEPRSVIFDPDAEAKALDLRAFHDASFGGGAKAILDGQITRKLGFGWFMDQNVPTHTAGTITTGAIAKAATAVAVGLKSIICTTAASTGAVALLVGDIVLLAGDSQTYVLTASVTEASAATDFTIAIEPGLQVALVGSEALTVKATHVANLGIHRDAIAFANRPLSRSSHPGSVIQAAVDPVTGIALRLELTREHKRDRFSYDILYGASVIRRELGSRLAG